MNPVMIKARGFTLMESVIAIGVVAVLLTTFLAVFGPASQSIRRSLSAQEADRLQSALERELQILREGTDSEFTTAFDKAFDWILNSGDAKSMVLLYNYRGKPTDIRPDGSLEPHTAEDGQSGRDFILQPAVRRKGDADPKLKADLEEVEGQIYYVRMTQLVFENGTLTDGEPGEIVNPHDGEPANTAADYAEGVIAFKAEFYALRSNSSNYIDNLKLTDEDGDGRPDSLGRPLFTRNLGVRR